MSRQALVTGATGFIGSHLVDALIDEEWSVRCTVRRTSNLRWIEGRSVEGVECDLRRAQGIDRACDGVDTIFHVAGVISARTDGEFREGNWLASKNLVEGAIGAGVRRIVHVSSLAAAGPSPDGEPLSEEMPPRPVSAYGRSKLEGEQEILRRAGEIEAAVVRPPVVYGPRDEGLLQMYQALRFGVKFSIGGPKFISIVHVDDLVDGILLAADNEAAAGQAYFVCNAEPLSMTGAMDLIMDALGKKRRWRITVPEGLVRALGGLADGLSFSGLFSRDKAVEMTQKFWVCSPAKAERELGFRAQIPVAEGMRETAEWYRENGWVK
ncbi:MAG: NAD-dependent epimerase/dehydratase family protein [Planctomycetota bacterium]|jgi:nucleoside-diphosphate-sugar epimerase